MSKKMSKKKKVASGKRSISIPLMPAIIAVIAIVMVFTMVFRRRRSTKWLASLRSKTE